MAESKPQKATPDAAPADAAAADTEKMVQEALAQAQASVKEVQAAADSTAPLPLPDLTPLASGGAPPTKGIELLSDVDLHVTIELGRTQMLLEDVLRLGDGSVVELDKLAGDPVDVYVNHRLVVRGEVLVLNDNFCIRISEIVGNLEEQAEAAAQEQAKHAG